MLGVGPRQEKVVNAGHVLFTLANVIFFPDYMDIISYFRSTNPAYNNFLRLWCRFNFIKSRCFYGQDVVSKEFAFLKPHKMHSFQFFISNIGMFLYRITSTHYCPRFRNFYLIQSCCVWHFIAEFAFVFNFIKVTLIFYIICIKQST